MDDTKGKEKITVHAQYDMGTTIQHDETHTVGGNKREKVSKSKHVQVTEDCKRKIDGSEHEHVVGELVTWVEQDTYHTVHGNVVEEFQKNHAQAVTQEYWLNAQRVVIKADQEICLLVGSNFISISPAGVIIEGTMVNINCGNPPSPSDPPPGSQCKVPEDPESPAAADNAVTGSKSAPN
jgi:type VI secretion system secreted protein VgrG